MTSPHRPLLIVIAGPNGSGKTTITSKLLFCKADGQLVKQYLEDIPLWAKQIYSND